MNKLNLTVCKGCDRPLYRDGTPKQDRPKGAVRHYKRHFCGKCGGRDWHRSLEYRETIREGVEPSHLTKFLEARRARGIPVEGVLMTGEK